MGLLAVSIDLDEVDCYTAIHGINCPDTANSHSIYRRALPRAARFFENLGIKSTIFVVGKDLSRNSEAISLLKELSLNGHEIGNHSMHHYYDLTKLSETDQARDIDEAHNAIKKALGVSPKGFRAPGYNINHQITDHLFRQNYSYDSSVFPCPIYYSAKVLAMGVKAIRGQNSKALIGDPRLQSAPSSPYRIGPDVWSRGNGLKELPITVLSKARLPFIGTSLALMGAFPSSMLARYAAKLPFVNLELHGIDFADIEGDGLSYLGEHQPDLRIPLTKRRETLKMAIDTLLNGDLEPVTLANAASRIFA